jgi:2-oxoglutarate dehydrogenase E2 component (dihydrolipoamide succinyltransferase)
MSVDVIMPQMGESIAEGTMVKWLKKLGDRIQRDEPLFEISTDKVDAEIPSPAEGILLEIFVKEGETVEINTIVGRIGAEGEKPAGPPAQAAAPAEPAATAAAVAPAAQAVAAPAVPIAAPTPVARPAGAPVKSSPVVQKIAAEHGIDVSLVEGTGAGGRITKKDILRYIEQSAGMAGAPTPGQAAAPPAVPPTARPTAAPPAAAPSGPVFPPGQNEVREDMDIMRKKIAEHMVMSKHTSPHVYSIFEIDMSNVVARRNALKPEFGAEGVKLTFLAFFMEAIIRGIKEYPIVNSSVDGEVIVYKKDVNIGVAVALENGLIVPVVKHADQMNLLGLAKGAADLADRARTKRLMPDDVQGGTFTITNVGVFGSVFGLPIINQPQVAILGIGTIVKRPVVVDDMIAIRPIAHVSLSYDHRIVDGADASRFMSTVKNELEKPFA